MKIAVLGAGGSLGRAIVADAHSRGHEPIAIKHADADVATGRGLEAVLTGADVVINAVNARTGNPRPVLLDGTRNVLAAAAAAGVGHYICVSIVGVDRVPMAYWGVKLEEERIVEASKVPWSLRRVTQFHDFAAELFGRTMRFGFVLGPPATPLQTIDVRDVATLFVDLAEKGPSGRVEDAGGPEVLLVKDLAKRWLAAMKRSRWVLPLPVPGALGKRLREGALTCPEQKIGRRTFDAWLVERYG